MPLYSDLGLYYAPHLTTPSYYSSPFLGTSSRSAGSLGLGLMPVPRLLPSRVAPAYSPLLASIPESGYSSARRALPSLDRTVSPRPVRYLPPKPVSINTSDIDVSAARFGQRRDRPEAPSAAGGEPERQPTIKRGRTVVRLHTKKFKENPALDTHRRMTPGEKLVQKFLILDKAEEEAKAARRKRIEEMEERERVEAEVAKLQAMAAKKAAADAEATTTAPDGTFALDPEMPSPAQNFPTIQGLTENAALDILLSATDEDEELVQGGEITRAESTGTVKKRKVKEKEGTVKAAKKKAKKKDGIEKSQSSADESPATGDEMIGEKSMLQRRNTIRFRRNSHDLEGFPEIEIIPGSRRSSFDQSPSSRRSSVDQSPGSRRSSIDSTGDETPMASEKKSTVKRRKGPKHKFVAEVSVDSSPAEPRSPKFVVDEVKVEHSPASPRAGAKKFRYEVIVEDVEAERAAGRGKSGKENKTEAVTKKKKANQTAVKPLADRQGKAVPKLEKEPEVKVEKKETAPKSFQKSQPEPAEETKTQIAISKTDEISGKVARQKIKEKNTQDVKPKLVTQEKNTESKPDVIDANLQKPTGTEPQDTKIGKKEKGKEVPPKDKKMLKDSEMPKLEAKDIQKGTFAVEKPKSTTLAAVVPKVEEAKLGKQVTEKTKATKHQPDPTPPSTPTIQKSDSGVNFWAFLNGSDEEKEQKKPVLPKVESLIQSEMNKTEKPKGAKVKPDLRLNLQNKCMPAEKIPDTADMDSKSTTFGKKIDEKTMAKTNEEKKAKFPRKSGDVPKDRPLDALQETKLFGAQKEPQSAPPQTSLDQKASKVGKDDALTITAKSPSDVDLSEGRQKVGLPAKTPDEKVPKWKALAKDRTKTPETADTTGAAAKNAIEGKKAVDLTCVDKKAEVPKAKEKDILGCIATKQGQIDTLEQTTKAVKLKDSTSTLPDLKSNEVNRKLVKELPESPVSALPKVPETPEKKPAPKWKAFGKQPPSTPASPKEATWSPKTPATPEPKNAETKPKSQLSQTFPETTKTSDVSPKVPSPTRDAADSVEKSPTTSDVAPEIAKVSDQSHKAKSPLGLQQKEGPVDDGPLKKNLLESQDNKEGKTSKSRTPEENSKPLPKWKAKVQADKDAELKKTPFAAIKQTSSDKSLAITTESSKQEESKIKLSEPPTSVSEKENVLIDAAKTPTSADEGKFLKPEPKTPIDNEKPPKKPLGKTKIAAKQQESTPKESELSRQFANEQQKTVSHSAVSDNSVTAKEVNESESKKEVIEKPEDKFPVGKPKLTEQKSKEEEKDVRTPFGKKIKLPEQKSLDKKDEGKTTPVGKKISNLTAQKSQEEEKSEIPLGSKALKKNEDAKDSKSEPTTPVKKGVKLIGQKSKEEEKSDPQTPLKKGAEPASPKKGENEPSSPVKKTDKLTTQKSENTEVEKKEPLPAAKKGPKLAAQKSKDEDKSEPPAPVKKVGKLAAQKSKEENSESSSPTKKIGKLVAQKSKEENTESPSSPVKTVGKLVAQKSKEDISEPSSPVKKTPKLPAQKSKEKEEIEPSSPIKKGAKLVAQKNKEDEKTEAPVPAKKGAKLAAQKSKEETNKDSADGKKALAPGKRKPKSGKKMEESKQEAAPVTLPPPTTPTPESGSEADSEDSSSEDEGDTTPHASASSSSSSYSSSDSGFDSRPSSVPGSPPSNKKVPSTASDASSREPGSPSPALARSQALDPYSEDAGLLPRAASSGRTTPPASSLPRFRKYTVDDFQFLKLLGKGSFGKVLLAELRGTDRYYAVKCLKKDVVLEDDDVECTLIERKVLALGTKHPYLCHLFCTFQTESHLLFVMEYLNGGDLMFHIQQSGRFPEPRARFYGAEIVSGLKFLHKKGIIYRDLKLDNILLDYDGHVRIADFGMCKLQIFLDRTADTFCGTPDYMAPEIIKGLKYNQCVDWWSFGVLVFEMLVGVSPFTGCDEDELFWSICNEQPQYPRFLSREAHSLLTSLLEKDALKRLGTPESPKGDVPDHVFFRSIDWVALETRDLDPPFRPRVKHPLDVQYFDSAFTAERAELTPVDASILQSMDQAQFQGFSYTNPNATD